MLTLTLLLACTPKLPATGDTGGVTATGVIDTADSPTSDSGTHATCLRYRDQDGDGFGDPEQTTDDCDLSGYTDVAGDCNDLDAAVFPDAEELCNTIDDDCDAAVDEGDLAPAIWYQDLDADGYGTPTATAESCEPPAGFAKSDDDCNDAEATIHPYADETCDSVDQDCDATVDEDSLDALTWYGDTDADGYGDPAATTLACELPADHTADASDCDDSEATVHPGADETCDGSDQDCDFIVDEDGTDAPTWYGDADADGYGDPLATTVQCDAPSGTVADPSDCDDTDGAIHPGAAELCDAVDQDCDTTVDEDPTDPDTFYADDDGDGHGNLTATTAACDLPSGHVVSSDDCDDADASVYPGASETCDSDDEDCDGAVDEDATDPATWYADTDGDSYGDPGSTDLGCDAPAGHVADDSDCDDGDAAIHPGASETCDTVDQDCDTTVDEDPTDPSNFYADTDSDGYGDPGSTTAACTLPASHATSSSDCDDTDNSVYPGASETCDSDDEDCDGSVDEDATDKSTWYADSDADGYGNAASPSLACSVPAGHVADQTDCDDTDSGVSPAGTETCDGADQDCDTTVDEDATDMSTYYADGDTDGYGSTTNTTAACDLPSGYKTTGTDCNDSDSAVHPGAAETCDDDDEDCDGSIDENATDKSTWYADTDGDSFGNAGSTTQACDQPSNYVSVATDCNDSDGAIYPGATEVCDSADQDCDGSTDEGAMNTWYYDSDGDGYGDATNASQACLTPSGKHIADNSDCYDYNSDANPGQTDFFDNDRGDGSFDYDCDGNEELEYADFYSCDDTDSDWADADCEGDDGWWDNYGYYDASDIPDCGEGEYWIFDCQVIDYWGYEYCDADYDYEYQNCR